MNKLSEKTRLEMEAGRARVVRNRAHETVDKAEGRLKKLVGMPIFYTGLRWEEDQGTWIVTVRVPTSADPAGMVLEEPVEHFPSDFLVTQMMLIGG